MSTVQRRWSRQWPVCVCLSLFQSPIIAHHLISVIFAEDFPLVTDYRLSYLVPSPFLDSLDNNEPGMKLESWLIVNWKCNIQNWITYSSRDPLFFPVPLFFCWSSFLVVGFLPLIRLSHLFSGLYYCFNVAARRNRNYKRVLRVFNEWRDSQ